MSFKKLTPIEKKITIKMRRLRRNRRFQELNYEEQEQYIKDNSSTEDVKEGMREYIKKAWEISDNEKETT